MSESGADSDLLGFAAKVLALLDEASYATTYKFALLLALIDRTREGTTEHGATPAELAVSSVAERVLELYWPQAAEFAGKSRPVVLKQSGRGQAGIVRSLVAFRLRHDLAAGTQVHRARTLPGYAALLRQVEWSVANMPLPRLQRPLSPFMFEIDWDEHTTMGDYYAGEARRISFLADASDHLVRLAPLLRPLIQTRWASMVARLNQDALDEAPLDRFLFAPKRLPPNKLLAGLADLQAGKCFYCGEALGKAHIDHFLAWSESVDEGIFNYVVACAACNLSKSARGAAAAHLGRWLQRFGSPASENLVRLANLHSWQSDPSRTLGLARAIYLTMPDGTPLWRSRSSFIDVQSERTTIRKLFDDN